MVKLLGFFSRKNSILMAIALGGIFLLLLTSESVQMQLQKNYYGNPRRICFSETGVVLGDKWNIKLIDYGKSRPAKLFGILPFPRFVLDDLQGSLFSLHLIENNSNKALIIYFNVVSIDKEMQIKNCIENPFCKVEDVKVGGDFLRTLKVISGEMNWFVFIDHNLMIATHLPKVDEIQFATNCTNPQARGQLTRQ